MKRKPLAGSGNGWVGNRRASNRHLDCGQERTIQCQRNAKITPESERSSFYITCLILCTFVVEGQFTQFPKQRKLRRIESVQRIRRNVLIADSTDLTIGKSFEVVLLLRYLDPLLSDGDLRIKSRESKIRPGNYQN